MQWWHLPSLNKVRGTYTFISMVHGTFPSLQRCSNLYLNQPVLKVFSHSQGAKCFLSSQVSSLLLLCWREWQISILGQCRLQNFPICPRWSQVLLLWKRPSKCLCFYKWAWVISFWLKRHQTKYSLHHSLCISDNHMVSNVVHHSEKEDYDYLFQPQRLQRSQFD